MSTPTPRTDAVEKRNGNVLCGSANLEFARTLERELDRERAYVSALEDQLDSHGIKMAQQQAANLGR